MSILVELFYNTVIVRPLVDFSFKTIHQWDNCQLHCHHVNTSLNFQISHREKQSNQF